MRLFKLPSYSVFDYKPRVYNQELERRREILREIRSEQGKDIDIELRDKEYKPGMYLKGGIHSRITRKTTKTNMSMIRILIAIVTLFLIGYIILVADLSKLISFFMK